MSAPLVRVRRDSPLDERPWRAVLLDVIDGSIPDIEVGYFPTQPEAVTTGVTAARFVAAGIPWRTVGVPELDGAA